ncbi:MAG: pyridoxal 5'-phosphate synthase glutaminase subunit PdxT [Chloroflexi bacterium]|nr:pyridoxal 5'-phosphate synthase glutaminase subunit PdxT [Chloroflexota bacterium]
MKVLRRVRKRVQRVGDVAHLEPRIEPLRPTEHPRRDAQPGEPLRDFARGGRPVWGTCAGMILLAERIVEGRPEPLGLIDMLVRRNGFGRQVDSFETDVDFAGLDGGPFHAVFIRAPAVVETGPAVEVLASLDDGTVVAARQGNLLATAFHPELTTDRRLHALFVAMLAAEVAR